MIIVKYILLFVIFILVACNNDVYRKIIVNDTQNRIIIQINGWEYFKSKDKNNIQIDEKYFEETDVKSWSFFNYGFDGDILLDPYLASILTVVHYVDNNPNPINRIIIYDVTNIKNPCNDNNVEIVVNPRVQSYKILKKYNLENLYYTDIYLKSNRKKCLLFSIEINDINDKKTINDIEKIITSLLKFV